MNFLRTNFIFQTDRAELQIQVKKFSHWVGGRVLDVGSCPFDRYSHLFKFDEYIRMDVPGTPNVDVHGYAEAIPFPDESFDTIVCTQTLFCLWDVHKVFTEFNRVLKKGGVLFMTDAFMNPLQIGGGYWRFTPYAYEKLSEEGGFKVEVIEARGNYWSVRAQMAVSRQIRKRDLFNSRIGRVWSFFFKLYGKFMIWRDAFEKNEVVTVSHGHILVATKK